MQTRVFQAKMHLLYDMLVFIHQFCINQKFQEDTISKITLSVEEALVNIIQYGYPNKKEGNIEITCREINPPPYSGITILIRDDGIPFNPIKAIIKTQREQKSFYRSAEERLIGGYGIYIYIELMDKVEYQRAEGKNILALTKYKYP